MVPSAASDFVPNNFSSGELNPEPVEFDGIGMFVISSLKQFADAFKDPYYLNVIEPDERVMLDKEGPGGGLIATYSGKMIDMVLGGKSMVGDKGKESREVWEEWEKKAAA